jgi:hypothetical protein
MKQSRFRTLPPERIMNWMEDPHAYIRLATYRDVLPGDWAAYMVPGLVDWRASRLSGAAGSYTIRNVNYGGNIVAGFTDLVTAEMPVDSLEEVQFILVPLDRMGTRGLVDHAMLRFVFNERSPIRITSGGNTDSSRTAGDFLISWEAWRSPGHPFNLIEGFNPDAFKLIPRFYIGAHRFLEDSVKGRQWNCYPLDMPGGEVGRAEVARETLATVLAHLDHGLDHSSIAAADTRHDNLSRQEERCAPETSWEDIADVLRSNRLPESPIDDMPHIYTSYQLLLRSCATMVLHSIELAAKRMAAHGVLGPEGTAAFDGLEIIKPVPWLEALGRSDLKSIVRQATYAIWWIARHQEVIPTKIPGILRKAGMLKMQGGTPVMHHYFSGAQSPYIDHEDFLSD